MTPPQPTRPLQFKIHGMDCAEEVAVLKRVVGPVVGGADNLTFDVVNGRMTVTAPDATANAVREAVGRTGMRAEPWRDGTPNPRDEGFWERWGRTVLTAASGGFIVLGFVLHAW